MIRLRSHLIGIDQGEVILFSDFDKDGAMWVGSGPRKAVAKVKFAENYIARPAVHCWLSMQDIANDSNLRTDVQAEDVTSEDFTIVFRTWGDTRIARLRVGWQSIGELADDDDWDITT